MSAELPEYEIRPLVKEDIPQIHEIAEEVGFFICPVTSTWIEYDPEGVYVAVTKDGQVIGACAGVLQHDDLAYIGLYMVKPVFQRRGVGRKIWDTVVKRIGDRNIAVDPVPSQLANYRDRAGCPIQTNWCNTVYVIKEVPVSKIVKELKGISVRVVVPDGVDITNNIIVYDAKIMGYRRDRLHTLQGREKDLVTVVATNDIDNSICGYGNIAPNFRGNAFVGPLFADNRRIAELILYHMVKVFPAAQTNGVALYMIDCNKDASAMFEELGFQNLECVPKLFSREEVQVEHNKIFAQHSCHFTAF